MATRRYPVREGKRAVSFFIEETTWRQLRLLCVAGDTNLQVLMAEAVEMLLEKHGRPELRTKTKS
jgi:hypothetical protein